MSFMGLSFKIVTALVLFNIVSADFQLTIILKSLTVNGKLQNGETCSPFSGLDVKCFPRPKICIEPLEYATDDLDQCVIGSYIDLGVGINMNTITYDVNAYYGAWYNPYTFKFFGPFTGFSVKMIVWNADGTNYQEIDRRQWNLTDASPKSADEAGDQISSFKFEWEFQEQTEPTAPPTIPTTPGSGGTTAALPVISDCKTVTTAGVNSINIGGTSVSVYCDGIGGTAIQKRTTDDSGTFDSMEISAYKVAIGTAATNYWIGLDNIHTFTSGTTQYTAVITTCCGTTPLVENYDTFKVGDAASNYVLTVTGAATNRLMVAGANTAKTDNGSPFSTYNNFNLVGSGITKDICASALKAGGWWFGSCENNLNGHYSTDYLAPSTCHFDAAAHYASTGAGISYPVGISFQKTQITLYQQSTFRNLDIKAAAQELCA